jgi:plastocyanin
MFRTPKFAILAATGALSFLVACEGEPPKVPTTPAAAEPPATEPAPAAPGGATPPAGPAPTGSGATPPAASATSACCGAAASPPPGTTGSPAAPAAPPGTAAAVPVGAPATPAAPAALVNVVGTVTTTPAKSAGSAVVYLEDAATVPDRGMSAHIDNRQMSFIPFVTVVAVGAKVVFANNDPFPHNVFSPDNERFDLGSFAQNTSHVHVFKKPGAYSLLCNLHPNMLGYVVVAPSSYFARADAKGHFTIKDVPAGTYKITAWAPRLQTASQAITVAGAEATASFELHR